MASLGARNRGWILATGPGMGRGLFLPAGLLAAKRGLVIVSGIRELIRTAGIPGDGSAATISHSETG